MGSKTMKRICWLCIFLCSLGISFFSIRLGSIALDNSKFAFLILLISIIIWCLSSKHAILKIKRDFCGHIQIFMFIWFIYGLINVFFVKEIYEYLANLIALFEGLVATIAFCTFFDKLDDIIVSMKAFLIAGVIHNIIGWQEYITGNYRFVNEDIVYAFRRTRNPVSSFGNCNDFATFIFFVLFISIILVLISKKKIAKILYFGIAASSVLMIVFSGSRANMLATFITAFILIVYMVFKSSGRKGLKYLLLAILTIFLGIIIGLYNGLQYIILNFFNDPGTVSSNSERIKLILNGIYFLKDSFGLGIGAGSVDYWLQNLARYPVTVHKLHNWFLEILTSYGIFIFVGYMWSYWKLIKRNIYIACKIKNEKEKWTSLCFGILLIGYVLSSISDGSNFLHIWLWCFWGVAIAKCNISPNFQKGK
ncbi:O-antigen ligase family protein [Lacrimispora amygdalina]|uniref:O-antigen ligase family protein n=1 Tax=Lacrimispora amygdalina TaxID=253257 RepID=UPI000BE37BCD|nr:O-antigen ligase family protein [Lacrimispora amygdalina]